jgi:hypothetical protein
MDELMPKIKKVVGLRTGIRHDASTNCKLEINETQKRSVSSSRVLAASEENGDKIRYGKISTLTASTSFSS